MAVLGTFTSRPLCPELPLTKSVLIRLYCIRIAACYSLAFLVTAVHYGQIPMLNRLETVVGEI